MRMTIRELAPMHTTFAKTAFDHNVGKKLPLNLPDGDTIEATLVEAVVEDNGQSVHLTFEW